jgi:hypothetical protein
MIYVVCVVVGFILGIGLAVLGMAAGDCDATSRRSGDPQ